MIRLGFLLDQKNVMKKVEEVYDAFFKVWNVTMAPRLISQPKWFKESPELKPEDIIYFQKTESELSNDWTVGQVDSVTKSKDGLLEERVLGTSTMLRRSPGLLTALYVAWSSCSMLKTTTLSPTRLRWRR